MTNQYYRYEGKELWQDNCWADRISKIDGLVQYLTGNEKLNIGGFPRPQLDAQTKKELYSGKVGAYLLPAFFAHWEEKGLTLRPLDMTEHWLAAVPSRALPKGKLRLPVLAVYLQGDYDDHYWPMDIATQYEAYLNMAVRDGWILLFTLSNKGPDKDRTYVNILQEASALFPCDMKQMYLDVSSISENLSQISCRVPQVQDLVKNVTSLEIPAIPMEGCWEYRGSLGRDLMMADKYSLGSFDREAVLCSETGKKLMEGILLEYRYDTIADEGFGRHFEDMGLSLQIHRTNGERWIVLAPKKVAEAKEKLPLVCVMQEVYEGNEHLAVTAFGYFYEITKIAASGECILLFFVLEDADSNDLLAQLIDEAAEKYPVDKRRVYVTGHSHDGRFTLEFCARNYRKIAACATLGNFCGLESAKRLGKAGVTDERMEQLRTIQLPLANFCGCAEHGGKLPVNVDARTLPLRPGQEFGRTLTLEDRLEAWHRRLYAWNCQPRTDEEILAVKHSPDIVERELGFPVDRSSVRIMDGFKHYIGDLKNTGGQYYLRMVGHENMPHLPTPAMLNLAWEFMSRFARNLETGEIEELW